MTSSILIAACFVVVVLAAFALAVLIVWTEKRSKDAFDGGYRHDNEDTSIFKHGEDK